MDKTKKGRIVLLILAVVLISLISGFLYYLFKPKSHNLFVSGRLEGYEVDISPKYGGEISYIAGREGKRVKKGELLAKIDDAELQAQLEAAAANVKAVIQQEKQTKLQLDVINSQIKQAQLTLSQSTEESSSSIQQAQSSLTIAREQFLQAQELLNQSDYDLSLALSDLKKYTNLITSGSVSKQVLEQAQTRYNTAKSAQLSRVTGLSVSQDQIKQAQALLAQAQASRYNPGIRKEQLNLLYSQLKQAYSQLAAAKSNTEQARAQKRQVLAQMSYFNITSPINAVIIDRTSEPGEIVSTGKIILTLLNYNSVYMRGYIPEGKIGLVHVGQPAYIYLDSAPKKPIPGYVSEIDAEASFTPENIYFREDRVKQVFGIKINVKNPEGLAKPGMPADGEIVLEKRQKNDKL